MSKVTEAYDLLADTKLMEAARCREIADEHDEFLKMLDEEIPESERHERRYRKRVFNITYQERNLHRFIRCVECNSWEEALVEAFHHIYGYNYDAYPDETQIKAYMTLCLHILQRCAYLRPREEDNEVKK